MSKFGVDISYHNGNIDFSVLSKNVEFIIIRAGYGQGNVDKKLAEYVAGCKHYNIPYGFYWFSYAPTVSMAISEAKYFAETVMKYKPIYPVFYDYEEESKNGKIVSFTEISNMAAAFIDTVTKYGLNCGIYCDNTFYEGYAKNFSNKVPIWYARWGSNNPVECDIFQYSETGIVDGIKGKVDVNICYKDYEQEKSHNFDVDVLKEMLKIYQEYDYKYTCTAIKVLNGNYGNGVERINKLKKENLDPTYVQKLVNLLVKYEIKPEG